MIKILSITIPGNTSERTDVKRMDLTTLTGQGFDEYMKGANTVKELHDAIQEFLQKAKDVWVPIKVINCEAQVKNKQLLVALQNEELSAQDLLTHHRGRHRDVRMVFNCQTNNGNRIYSNAIPDKVEDCHNVYLCKNAKVLTSAKPSDNPLHMPYSYSLIQDRYCI